MEHLPEDRWITVDHAKWRYDEWSHDRPLNRAVFIDELDSFDFARSTYHEGILWFRRAK